MLQNVDLEPQKCGRIRCRYSPRISSINEILRRYNKWVTIKFGLLDNLKNQTLS